MSTSQDTLYKYELRFIFFFIRYDAVKRKHRLSEECVGSRDCVIQKRVHTLTVECFQLNFAKKQLNKER